MSLCLVTTLFLLAQVQAASSRDNYIMCITACYSSYYGIIFAQSWVYYQLLMKCIHMRAVAFTYRHTFKLLVP